MKRKYIALLLLFLFTSSASNAKVVEKATAIKAAQTLVKQKVNGFDATVGTVTAVSDNGSVVYYVVNFANGGWALISANDVVKPLLGYSPTGIFSTTKQPDNVRNWLGEYSKEIRRCASLDDGSTHSEWNLNGGATRASGDAAIEPLIKVNWNQGSPYNKYCPKSSYVGCVAVSLAQAMSVFKYPEQATGTHGYNSPFGTLAIEYDKEDPYDWEAIMSGANNKDEVARLLYHCGVAVDMQYGLDGSGTQQVKAANALKTYFKYPSSVSFSWRSSYDGNWEEMLIGELENGNPIIYCGSPADGSTGHSFNIDGYDGQSMFHLNWGWGGSNNGYFSIDGLKPGSDDWTSYHGAVTGIHTLTDSPTNITLSAYSVAEGQPSGTEVADVTVESNAKNPQYKFTLRGEYSPLLHGYADVPFKIENGKMYTTAVLQKADSPYTMDITVENTSNNTSYTKRSVVIYVTGTSDEAIGKSLSLSYDKTTKAITITSANAISYTMSTSNGIVVGDGRIPANGEAAIDISDVTSEYCTLEISSGAQKRTITIKLKSNE